VNTTNPDSPITDACNGTCLDGERCLTTEEVVNITEAICVNEDDIDDDDCTNGLQLNKGGDVSCAEAQACGDALTCEVGTFCTEAYDADGELVKGCATAAVPDCESQGMLAEWQDDMIVLCISDSVQGSCDSNDDCVEEGYICVEHQCIQGEESVELSGYKYVRIDDLTDPQVACCGTDDDGNVKSCTKCTMEDPGADIDAVVLIKKDTKAPYYAVDVKGYANDFQEGGNRYNESVPMATYAQAILDKPDSLYQYGTDQWPEDDAECRYVKAGAPAYPNYKAEDRTFVSLGGQGGYIIVEMGEKIEEGDTLDVLELGECKMIQSDGSDKSASKVPAEKVKIQIAVKSDAAESDWKVLSDTDGNQATNGLISFTIPTL
jgi:hypothetical protein